MVYERVLRPLLFRIDPETAHNAAIAMIARGLVRGRLLRDPRLATTAVGLEFPNPLGLAAGFDKNAVAVDRWKGLGFGFAEIGTVTLHPQPGNPKPRLFRLPADRALVNRLGFNNEGAETIAARLARARPGIPLGVNIGKSKSTPLAEATGDYAASYERLLPYGDYFVVNVSSPNTPGLRGLQERGPLEEILAGLGRERPLLVKVAPDLTPKELDDVLDVASSQGLAGIVATNSTISRQGLTRDPGEEGGLSGAPLAPLADATLGYLAKHRPQGMTLIGVGGIFTGADLYRKLRLGANLAQVYTGWVYGGPSMAARTLLEYLAIVDREGPP